MGRRKRRKVSQMKSTMFIITIIVLSSLGAGYGYWNEGLGMDFAIEAGDIDPRFISGSSEKSGSLDFEPSKDGKTLSISGSSDPSSQDIIIKIKNHGSIPVLLDKEVYIGAGSSGTYIKKDVKIEYPRDKVDVDSLGITDPDFDIESYLEELYPVEPYQIGFDIYFEQGIK